jgi:DNA-directed RNA polymerase subunit omega
MARVTVEDCIRYYPNRFELVLLASRRARQLMSGMEPFIEDEPHKPAVQSLKEMGAGHISWEGVFELEERERARLQGQAAEDEAA